MTLVKHPEHGNKHVAESEVADLVAAGWSQWPRKAEEKALGDGSDAAYWRKKHERDMAAMKAQLEELKHADPTPSLGGGGGPIEPGLVEEPEVKEKPARRGRPSKA